MGFSTGDGFIVSSVVEDSVAQKSGVVVGCRLVRINGDKSTLENLNSTEAPCVMTFELARHVHVCYLNWRYLPC